MASDEAYFDAISEAYLQQAAQPLTQIREDGGRKRDLERVQSVSRDAHNLLPFQPHSLELLSGEHTG